MLFVAMVFLVFALLMLARVFRGSQSIWLGLILLAFGASIGGLVGLAPRFSNYSIEGLLDLPLDQPVWVWRILNHLSLEQFIRFRLWSAVAFFIGVTGFAFSYTVERFKPGHYWISGGFAIIYLYILTCYDPALLFHLYKLCAISVKFPAERREWERGMVLWDQTNLGLITALLGYCLYRIFRVVRIRKIPQKRIQALFVGISVTVLCIFFVGLFCDGQGSILNARNMAVTLLPLGRDYPIFDATLMRAIPFGASIVIAAVVLSMSRYGFLGSWRVGTRDLDRQITVANQAVKMALHSFKNQFLGIQMAMDITSSQLSAISGAEIDGARVQIDWAKNACREAMVRLEVLQSQAQILQVNPSWLRLTEVWEAAKAGWESRLGSIGLVEKHLDAGIWIWADRKLMIPVFENLFQNALDALAGKDGEEFNPVVTIEIGHENEWGFFRIHDNGPGIPRENWRRIFHPFYTTKPAKSNWGLGLTYCHRVIKLHRGYINLRSGRGMETTFEVVLRCREFFDRTARN
jgi:signal transduction histidine kinase